MQLSMNLPPEPLKPEDCTVAHRQMQGERALAAFRNTHSPGRTAKSDPINEQSRQAALAGNCGKVLQMAA